MNYVVHLWDQDCFTPLSFSFNFNTIHCLTSSHFYTLLHTITKQTLTEAPMMMKMWASDWWNSSSSCSSFLSSPNTSERERGMFAIFSKKQTKNKVFLNTDTEMQDFCPPPGIDKGVRGGLAVITWYRYAGVQTVLFQCPWWTYCCSYKTGE